MFKPWVIDGHCDSIGDYIRMKRTLSSATEGGHWDIERARAGGMALQIMACFIESEFKPHASLRRGLELIHAAQRFIDENHDRVFLIRNRQDLNRLPNPDKLGILLSVEGGEILGESLFMLDIIYELGVRALGLTWNQRNALADGAGEQTNSRLTHLGQNVIRRMNELGMLIDVSHLNEDGFYHVLELTDGPIVASHSCAYALCPHPRNLTDDQLKALALNHGLVGVNFYSRFLTEKGEAGLEHVVQHITHIAEVAGVATIGLGSDFDGIDQAPRGLEDAAKFSDRKYEDAVVAFIIPNQSIVFQSQLDRTEFYDLQYLQKDEKGIWFSFHKFYSDEPLTAEEFLEYEPTYSKELGVISLEEVEDTLLDEFGDLV